mmetsp:Transcript_113065/g.284341  ORF Transcript_113065/g.284341 Transcript_113065/m.284341 type:complete len:255 (+) Transcript_113065:341-1105(+)
MSASLCSSTQIIASSPKVGNWPWRRSSEPPTNVKLVCRTSGGTASYVTLASDGRLRDCCSTCRSKSSNRTPLAVLSHLPSNTAPRDDDGLLPLASASLTRKWPQSKTFKEKSRPSASPVYFASWCPPASKANFRGRRSSEAILSGSSALMTFELAVSTVSVSLMESSLEPQNPATASSDDRISPAVEAPSKPRNSTSSGATFVSKARLNSPASACNPLGRQPDCPTSIWKKSGMAASRPRSHVAGRNNFHEEPA